MVKTKNLNLKAGTMVDYFTEWFEITEYKNKQEIKVANLVEIT